MGWARTGQGGIHDRPEIDMIGCAPHTIVLANSCWKLWDKVTPHARLTKIIVSQDALYHPQVEQPSDIRRICPTKPHGPASR